MRFIPQWFMCFLERKPLMRCLQHFSVIILLKKNSHVPWLVKRKAKEKNNKKGKAFVSRTFQNIFLFFHTDAIAHIGKRENLAGSNGTNRPILQTSSGVKGPGGIWCTAVGKFGAQQKDACKFCIVWPSKINESVENILLNNEINKGQRKLDF